MDLLTSSIRKSVHSLSDLSKISHENEILSRVGGGGEGGSTEPPNRSEFAPEEFVLAPDKSTSNGYPQHMFWIEISKISVLFGKKSVVSWAL